MKIVTVKGVFILDKHTGSYVLHGDNDKTPTEMFKLLTDGQNPIWHFDPTGDTAHAVEFKLVVPEMEEDPGPNDYQPDGS